MRFFILLFGLFFPLLSANIVNYEMNDNNIDGEIKINLFLDENWNGKIIQSKENNNAILVFTELDSRILFNRDSVQLKTDGGSAKLILKNKEAFDINIENQNNTIAIAAIAVFSPLSIEGIAKEASGEYSLSIFDILWYAVIFMAIFAFAIFVFYRINLKRRLKNENIQADNIVGIDEFVKKSSEKPSLISKNGNNTEKSTGQKSKKSPSRLKEKTPPKTLFDI